MADVAPLDEDDQAQDMRMMMMPDLSVKMIDAPQPAVSEFNTPVVGKGIFAYLDVAGKPKSKTPYIEHRPLIPLDPYTFTQDTINPNMVTKRAAPSGWINHSNKGLKRRYLSSPYGRPNKAESFKMAPREIRDELYRVALKVPKPISLNAIHLPPLCFLNHEFSAEAIPVFYATNSFKGDLYMNHSYQEALDPKKYHEVYERGVLSHEHLEYLSNAQRPEIASFAAKKLTFDILDKDQAHFASLDIEVSKRGRGSVLVKCTDGPEVVADNEKLMCLGLK